MFYQPGEKKKEIQHPKKDSDMIVILAQVIGERNHVNGKSQAGMDLEEGGRIGLYRVN